MELIDGKQVESSNSTASLKDYLYHDGLRMVRPYYFDFVCHVKQRWAGQCIVDLFAREFPARTREYYETAVRDGRLRVEGRDGSHAPCAYAPLKEGQCMRHFIHRHEPPVLDTPVQVVAVTDTLVAVRKPATLPVHACGQYRKNSVLSVLSAQHPELAPLLPLHRLDRPVSGLLLFARSRQAANELQQAIQGGEVDKRYVARVLGVFPASPGGVPLRCAAPLAWDAASNHASVDEAGGRAAETLFSLRAVAADGRTSLVECRPVTGRSHQIRVHLSHLGHPIANDRQYGGTYPGPVPSRTLPMQPLPPVAASGGSRCADAAPMVAARASGVEQVAAGGTAAIHACAQGAAAVGAAADGTRGEERCGVVAGTREAVIGKPHSAGRDAGSGSDSEEGRAGGPLGWLCPEAARDPLCVHCPGLPPRGWSRNLHPLWLHAERYAGPGWEFECDAPQWADPGFVPPLEGSRIA